MALDIISTLELDKETLCGRVILIQETSGCEANFFYSCLIAKALKDESAICLVTVQNDFNHYHNMGLKMGHNLMNLKNTGRVINVDYLQLVSDSHCTDNAYPSLVSCNKSENDLYCMIDDAVSQLQKSYKSVCVIIDDLTDFLLLNYGVSDINRLVQKCRLLVGDKCSLVMGVHVISANDTSYTLAKLFSHMSDIVCEVSGLSTGRSVDVSGSFKVVRPWLDDENEVANKFTSINHYLFKLFERGIKVFAPGTR
ncbi:elongator complex protein 6 [Arctopsyche grandis]|uniref:elongator complex protein 6 n=1 Tax=Arctopsyche grandis TaxID=121162 RepID=UPI00406D6464